MPDRIARPPIKLLGGLPDGNLCGVAQETVKELLATKHADFYALVRVRREGKKIADEPEGEIAELKVIAIEELPDWQAAAEQMHDLRSERIGDNPIDFDDASDAEWAQLSELRQWVADYAAREGLSDTALGEKVLATVPGAGAGWRDSAQVMREFRLTVEESTSDGES